jgi:hypothetical protein
MLSFSNWNKGSSGMFFNRKSVPCAILQGGVVIFAMSMVLKNPKASRWEISTALTMLALTYDSLSEQPCPWSGLFFLAMIIQTDSPGSATLSHELKVIRFFGLTTFSFRLNSNDTPKDSDVRVSTTTSPSRN